MRRAVTILVLIGLAVGAGITGAQLVLGRLATQPRMLVLQTDGNLALITTNNTVKQLTTDADSSGRAYCYPTPAPDGRSVAYVAAQGGCGADPAAALVVQQIAGQRRTVFKRAASSPFYLHWSPDSTHIAFLTSERGDMLLRDVRADGSAEATAIIPGNPSYFAWTPDSQRLILHTRGEAPVGTLSVWTLGDQQPTLLKSAPAYFRTPAWLPDGHTALATIQDERGVALARLGDDGTVQQVLAHTAAGLVFVAAPDGRQVAYIDMTQERPSLLHIVGVDGQNDHAVSSEDAVTFLWSPDARRIAYLTVARNNDQAVAFRQHPPISVRWNVLDLASGKAQQFKPFTPTAEFFAILPYFDQYAQSVRLWDHAGQHLLYADPQGVWSIDVATGTPTKVSDGVLGLWMER